MIDDGVDSHDSEGARDLVWRELADWDLGDPEAEEGFAFKDKLVTKTGWSEGYALRVMDEFRRFVFLWICCGKARYVPSPDVDEVWHLAILFTRRYALMCRRFCSGFRHHNPSISRGEKVGLRDAYGQTLRRYLEVFGERPPADIWPIPRGQHDPGDCGILDCHERCDGPHCDVVCQADCE
jgi:hypothetical protein